MPSDLTGPASSEPPRTLLRQQAADQVAAFQRAAVSANTQRAYDGDWRAFIEWCGKNEHSFIPAHPHHVSEHLAWMASLRTEDGKYRYARNSVERRLAAINKAHEIAHLTKPGTDPDVTLTMAGIRRTRREPEKGRQPILLDTLKLIMEKIDINSWPGGVIGHRDSAIVLFGFSGAYRRSEMAMLDIGDVLEHSEDGLHVNLRYSKTDQEGKGLSNALPFGEDPLTCAPCWYRRWLRVMDASYQGRPQAMRAVRETNVDEHECSTGGRLVGPLPNFHPDEPLFRPVMKNGAIKYRHFSGSVINAIVHRRAAAAGFDDTLLGAHSLRAGFITQAFRDGANAHEVMRQTNQKDVATVERYSKDNDPLAHNAVNRIRL